MAPLSCLNAGDALVEDVLLERLEHVIHEWLDAIRATLGFDPLADRRAAARLDELLSRLEGEGRLATLEDVARLVRGRDVLVVAAGDCIELGVPHEVLVAADGATSIVLHELGRCPDIIVSDLDGVIEDIVFCSKLGSLVVVHAHGDNIWVVEEVIDMLDHVLGTVQAPVYSRRVALIPGFTDGDRAVWLAALLGAKRVRVTGWCPSRPQIAGSKRLPNPLKPRKLVVGEVMLRLTGVACAEVQIW